MLGEEQRGADRGGRVDVVPARMGDTVDRAAVVDLLLVVHRQGVEVGTNRSAFAVPAGEVRDEAGPDAEPTDVVAGLDERVFDDVRRAELLTAELGVGVEVAPEGDQLLLVAVDPAPDDLAGGGRGSGHRFVGVSLANSSTR